MPPSDELTALIALLHSNGIGTGRCIRLVEGIGSAIGVFSARDTDISGIAKIPIESARNILNNADQVITVAEKIIAKCAVLDIKIITTFDELYPSRLKTVPDRPVVLYTRGVHSPLYNFSVALVGTRSPSDHITRLTPRLATELTVAGVTVVSGMALGVDTLAHEGALQAGGRTIAVLGNGLDIIYPPSNRRLFEKIIENGWVISEYPPGVKPDPHHFPQRNRIISGLSIGVVVVEAGPKSGALITADIAIEQGRELMAIPGAAGALRSIGTNQLIKQGTAVLVESAADILDQLKSQLAPVRNVQATVALPSLSETEKKIYNCLEPGSQMIDDLIRACGLTAMEFNQALTALQLKGVVMRLPGARVGRK